MSVKLSSRKINCPTRRLGRHIMHRLRYGKINRMMESLIYGLWVVCCMSCAHQFHPSEQMTCKASTKKLSKVNIHAFQTITHKKWPPLSSSCYKSTRSTDRVATNYQHCQLLKHYQRNFTRISLVDTNLTKTI